MPPCPLPFPLPLLLLAHLPLLSADHLPPRRADVDVDAAVKTVMNGLLTNGGQICTAHSRLIVQEGMKDKLLPALKTALEKVELATSPLEDTEALPGWDNMWYVPILKWACHDAKSTVLTAQNSGSQAA